MTFMYGMSQWRWRWVERRVVGVTGCIHDTALGPFTNSQYYAITWTTDKHCNNSIAIVHNFVQFTCIYMYMCTYSKEKMIQNVKFSQTYIPVHSHNYYALYLYPSDVKFNFRICCSYTYICILVCKYILCTLLVPIRCKRMWIWLLLWREWDL